MKEKSRGSYAELVISFCRRTFVEEKGRPICPVTRARWNQAPSFFKIIVLLFEMFLGPTITGRVRSAQALIGGPRLKQCRLITELSKHQLSKAWIADKTGCSIASVYRHVPEQIASSARRFHRDNPIPVQFVNVADAHNAPALQTLIRLHQRPRPIIDASSKVRIR